MASNTTNEFLEHYGIPGMRWGKRNAAPDYKKSIKISTYGGNSPHKNLSAKPVSIDAMKARNYQVKVKSGGTSALTTKQLQELVNRQNLEQQYSRLNPPQVSAGKQIIGMLMPVAGAALYGQYQARRPQQAPVAATPMSTALALPASKKQIAGDILLSAGKQILAEQGLNIGKAILTNLLK